MNTLRMLPTHRRLSTRRHPSKVASKSRSSQMTLRAYRPSPCLPSLNRRHHHGLLDANLPKDLPDLHLLSMRTKLQLLLMMLPLTPLLRTRHRTPEAAAVRLHAALSLALPLPANRSSTSGNSWWRRTAGPSLKLLLLLLLVVLGGRASNGRVPNVWHHSYRQDKDERPPASTSCASTRPTPNTSTRSCCLC